jgi:hypothetical protein
MNLTKEYGMNKLVATCPNCHIEELFCGIIPTEIESLVDREVLFCKQCKFVIAVDEFKDSLSKP